MRTIHFLTAVLFLAAPVESATGKPGEFAGIPKIIDGDTVAFGEIRLQLEGMDAPQMDQLCFDQAGARWKCGVAARERLEAEAGDKSWRCEVVRKNLVGRMLARCRAGGEDIARQMVRNGWALASTTGSTTYLANEAEARASAAGLWAGTFVAPLDWRQHNWHARILGNASVQVRSLSAQLLTSAFGASPPAAHCAIKGNVVRSGKCIFHRPGSNRYQRITMEARRGDRWFCTPIEAMGSGCRETRQ